RLPPPSRPAPSGAPSLMPRWPAAFAAVRPGGSALMGVAGQAPEGAHPALVVKIDNAPKARPQAGLNEADVVFEEAVEGGITRFAAGVHCRPADPGGPGGCAVSADDG